LLRPAVMLTGACSALLALLATAAYAQGPAARGAELRLGAQVSTTLVHDEVAHPRPGFPQAVDEARLRATPAPMLGVALWAELAPNVEIEASGGWTFARLVVHEDGTRRSTGGLAVGHVVVSLRHHVQAVRLRGGIGAIHYRGDAGLFGAAGYELRPLAEAGLGWPLRLAGAPFSLELTAQVHGFGTTALRQAGGLDGTVARFGLAAGYAAWRRP
jgi:hypothetical protein